MVSQKYIYPSLSPEEELNENISSERKEYDLTNPFERVAKSDFRSRFHLSMKDREYIMEKGLPTIRNHSEDFKDGKRESYLRRPIMEMDEGGVAP